MNKAILYYTCNTHDPKIDEACRRQLLKAGLPIICVSLNKPLIFGDVMISLRGDRGPEMMHRQIVEGLRVIRAKYVFLCESDVLYHTSHFDFTPVEDDTFYYNTNIWRVHFPDGLATWTDDLQQVSGLCASRDLLYSFYYQRLEQIRREGFNRHYEPGAKQNICTDNDVVNWQSECPNIDLRHTDNLTKSKRSPKEFRNPKYAQGWKEAESVDGWGKTFGILDKFMESV